MECDPAARGRNVGPGVENNISRRKHIQTKCTEAGTAVELNGGGRPRIECDVEVVRIGVNSTVGEGDAGACGGIREVDRVERGQAGGRDRQYRSGDRDIAAGRSGPRAAVQRERVTRSCGDD